MIRTFVLAIGLLIGLTAGAAAQGCGNQNPNCIVPTAPPGTSNNQAASTAFVGAAISAAVPALPSADIFVGNASNAAVARALSGSCTITNLGVITCGVTSGAPGLGCGLGALIFTDPVTGNVRCDNQSTVVTSVFGMGLSIFTVTSSALQIGQTITAPDSGTWTSGGISGSAISGSSGSFTTLAASSTVSGTGFSTYLSSPPAIGGTTPAAGAFANLSSSGPVSGAGFSSYLASPPAIGGSAPAAGTFTAIKGASLTTTNLLASSTAPTIGSCGGGTPSISANNGTGAFRVTVGSATNTCVINLPAATTGWNCFADNVTTNSTGTYTTKMVPGTGSGTSVSLGNYSDVAVLTNWATSDVLAVSCFGY